MYGMFDDGGWVLCAHAMVVVMLLSLLLDVAGRGWKRAAISPFWVFSFFFVLAYPVRYQLIEAGIPIQSPGMPDRESFQLALCLSFVFWLIVFLIYSFVAPFVFSVEAPSYRLSTQYVLPRQGMLKIALVIMLLVSFNYYFKLFQGVGFQLVGYYAGGEQHEARIGGGVDFFAGEIYEIAFVLFLFLVRKRADFFSVSFFFAVFLISFISTILLATRRPMYLIGYYVLMYMFLCDQSSVLKRVVLAAFPIVLSLMAPIGQYVRYSFMSLVDNGAPSIGWGSALTALGSTFEGAEHLARYIEVIDTRQLLFGVDYGAAYVFKAGLSLFPRAVWVDKPLLYGAVEQQDFLWSTGYGVTTLPPGIVVDALYGFGAFGFVFYSCLVGFFLRWIENTLFHMRGERIFSLAIAVYAYVYMFNFIRGGTSILQGVLMLSIWLFMAYVWGRLKFKLGS